VVVVDYDPNWALVFLELRERLASALEDLPRAIDHVGSTSIPGATAKPIIDIDVVLRSSTDLVPTIRALGRIGYLHEGDGGIVGREAFVSPVELPAHHLYVVIYGNSEYDRHIAFRNYLREHSELVEQYSALKKTLAAKYRDDGGAYTKAKSDFINTVLRRARKDL